MLDPTDYLAAIPQQTILRHKELVTLGIVLIKKIETTNKTWESKSPE